MDHRPKCKPKTMKQLEENTEKIFVTLGQEKKLLDITSKALSIKENIDKLQFIKILKVWSLIL